MKTRRWLRTVFAAMLLPLGAAHASDSNLQICIAAAADYSAIYPTKNIPSSLREVSAVFSMPDGQGHNVSGKWIAVDVGQAAPPNYAIGASSSSSVSKGRLHFTLPRPLPVGKYRLDVAVDGKPWQSAEFNVVQDLPIPKATQPSALLPAEVGQTWTYDFVQQAGAGAKVDLPDIKPDAEGKYRATTTASVVGEDANGKHVELRRNGALVFEEWWRIDASGLAATKRKQGSEAAVLDPPQTMWRWPLDSAISWTYTPSDHSYEEAFNMWGPLPVKTPSGEKSAFLVLADLRSGATNITAEREYVPGVGLVHETDVTALNDDMLSRQELSLRAVSTTAVTGRAPAAEAIEAANDLAGIEKSPKAFHSVANPSLKAGVGRLVVAFPPTSQRLDARVDVYDAGSTTSKQFSYGDMKLELAPARYDVSVNGIVVHNVPVQAGQDTLLHVGVLHTAVPSGTRVNFFAPGGQSPLKFVFGESALGFPVGTVDVASGSERKTVSIEDGKITDY